MIELKYVLVCYPIIDTVLQVKSRYYKASTGLKIADVRQVDFIHLTALSDSLELTHCNVLPHCKSCQPTPYVPLVNLLDTATTNQFSFSQVI